MKVCLLYENRERMKEDVYYDTASIIQDLGLIRQLHISGAGGNS